MIRPFRFSLARSSSRSRRFPFAMSAISVPTISRHGPSPVRDVRDLCSDDLEARSEVLLARADVDAEQARVGVLRRERVDGVRHPALLANLLEQARGGGAAEDRVEDRRCEAPAVGA